MSCRSLARRDARYRRCDITISSFDIELHVSFWCHCILRFICMMRDIDIFIADYHAGSMPLSFPSSRQMTFTIEYCRRFHTRFRSAAYYIIAMPSASFTTIVVAPLLIKNNRFCVVVCAITIIIVECQRMCFARDGFPIMLLRGCSMARRFCCTARRAYLRSHA